MKSQRTYPNRGLPVYPPWFQKHKPKGVTHYYSLLPCPDFALRPHTDSLASRRATGREAWGGFHCWAWVRGMGMGKDLSQMIHCTSQELFKSQFEDPISVLPLQPLILNEMRQDEMR